MTTTSPYSRISSKTPAMLTMPRGLDWLWEFDSLASMAEYLAHAIDARGRRRGRRPWRWIQCDEPPFLVALQVEDAAISLSDIHERLVERGVAHVGWSLPFRGHAFAIVTDALAHSTQALQAAQQELAALAGLPELPPGPPSLLWPIALTDHEPEFFGVLEGDWLPARGALLH